MSDENATQETLSTGDYREATVVPGETRPTESIPLQGRVVSTGRTTGEVEVRVTTRQVAFRRATE